MFDGEEESDLINKILSGDVDQFQKLVTAYQARIYAMIMRVVSDQVIAEDLTQEAFIRAFRNLSSFRHESKFISWLTRIAINLTNNYFSSLHFRESKNHVSIEDNSEKISASDPYESLAKEQIFEKLRLIVSELPHRYREVIVLCSFENKSYQETSEILGIPIGTVASRMNKAFQLIRRKFKVQGTE